MTGRSGWQESYFKLKRVKGYCYGKGKLLRKITDVVKQEEEDKGKGREKASEGK